MLGDASLQTQNKGRTYRLKFAAALRMLAAGGDKIKHIYIMYFVYLMNEFYQNRIRKLE